MEVRNYQGYSRAEEITNSITHGVAALLSVAGLTVLVMHAVQQGDPWRIVSFSIYGASLVALFLSSTLYHSIPAKAAKRFFQRMDHAAIYLLIAGTYTPFMLVTMRGTVGWTLLAIVWTLAATGIALEIIYRGRFKRLSLVLYLSMGWLGLAVIKPVLGQITSGGLTLLAVGGLLYTFGVIFYVWKRLPFNHAIWHVFVFAASTCHFFAVACYVQPT